MTLATIDWHTIVKLLWAAPLAGIAVSLTFSLVILGTARANDARRAGAGGTAAGFTVLLTIAGLAFVAVVIYGVEIITTK